MSAATFAVEGLSWSADGRAIVRDVHAEAVPGRVLGLLGPNGSGKSTLLRLAAGLVRADAGRSVVDGTTVQGLGDRDRARLLSLVEQETSTELDLRVEDVVALGRAPHRGRWPGGDPDGDAVVRRSLRRTSALDLLGRRWQTLSGGERQRVQLARALAQEPRVLLLDEPTNHLDLRHQLALMRLVRDSGVTAVAALHDLGLATAFCDRVVVLDRGEVAASGPPGEVLTPALLRRVWQVDAEVVPHPLTGAPLVVWDPR